MVGGDKHHTGSRKGRLASRGLLNDYEWVRKNPKEPTEDGVKKALQNLLADEPLKFAEALDKLEARYAMRKSKVVVDSEDAPDGAAGRAVGAGMPDGGTEKCLERVDELLGELEGKP